MQHVQQELLEKVLTLTRDPRTILSALAASKALRAAAAQLIECLVVKDGSPAAHIWQTFPHASRIKVISSYIVEYLDHLQYFESLLATLPARIYGFEDSTKAKFHSVEASVSYAQALAASSFSSNLRSVKIGMPLLTPAAADIILQGLPQLQEAVLGIRVPPPASRAAADQPVWRPKPGSCSELLKLDLDFESGPTNVLDLSGLSSATKLQQLLVRRGTVSSITALQALVGLQRFEAHCEVDAATWAVLAKLPSLHTIKIWVLEIGADAPAAAVTRLECSCLDRTHNKAQLPGCLARQLPLLQQLHVAVLRFHDPTDLFTALQGHQQLRELSGNGIPACWSADWALLAALPRLQRADLGGFESCVEIDESAPAAAALHTLESTDFDLLHSDEQLPGCLARQLPQVQRMRLASSPMDHGKLATALQGHQQLRELLCHEEAFLPAAWATMAGLPRLEMLHALTVHIGEWAPEAAALHTLVCDGFIKLQYMHHPLLLGCLDEQAPQLQLLKAKRAHMSCLAAALEGHQQLQSLHIQEDDERLGLDPGQHHDVLTDLASCSRLQELSVPARAVTAAGCAALAAGACRESLRGLELRWGASWQRASGVHLLSAGLPAMCSPCQLGLTVILLAKLGHWPLL
jgi:hypothetical protein